MADLWKYLWADKPIGEIIGIIIGSFAGILTIWGFVRVFFVRLTGPSPEPIKPDLADSSTVTLSGTTFEQRLREVSRVSELLRGWPSQAQESIDFLMTGFPILDDDQRRRITHRDIRKACLELIIQTLNDCRQRATFGAVAGIVGGAPVGLMNPYPKNHLYSWVVAANNDLPTGYEPNQMHPDLEKRPGVISDSGELRRWLANPYYHYRNRLSIYSRLANWWNSRAVKSRREP